MNHEEDEDFIQFYVLPMLAAKLQKKQIENMFKADKLRSSRLSGRNQRGHYWKSG
jgi:hypothetical protein